MEIASTRGEKYMGIDDRNFITTKDIGFDRTIFYNND